jgi:sarcosine oxidase
MSYDVCVVGLGAMGSQAALALQRRGLKVIALDRYRPPHGYGSSHGRTRVIREAYFENPFYVPFVRRAYELWHGIEDESGQQLLTYTGCLMVGQPTGDLLSGARRSANEHGISHETFTASQTEARYPVLSVPSHFAAMLEPRAGVISAEKAIDVTLSLALGHGAELRFNELVIHWHATNGAIHIETDSSSYRAEKLVLTAGPWTNDLIPTHLPLNVARQPMFWFEPARRAELFDKIPVFMWESEPGRIFYGYPRDGDGLKIARHHLGEPTIPDTIDRALRREDEEELRSFLRLAMPDANGRCVRHAACMYTNTPDHHFVIDYLSEGDDRVILVSACSGHGFKFAPVVGDLAADLITRQPRRVDLAPFSVARFSHPTDVPPATPASTPARSGLST